MATWDGSYPEPDGTNYYVNSTGNHTAPNIPTWDYYVPTVNNTYNTQNASAPYAIDTSMVFEQRTPNFYNHVDRNAPLMTNVAPNTSNAYRNNGIEPVANKVSPLTDYCTQ